MRHKAVAVSLVMLLNITFNEASEIKSSDLDTNEQRAAKTMIVSYKKSKMTAFQVTNEHTRIKNKCQCDIQHLPNVGAFILTYTTANHAGVDILKLDPSKEIGVDDEVVTIFDDDLTRRQTPTDPAFHSQWPLKNLNNEADINAQDGWDQYLADTNGGNPTGPKVVVAVIDTGIDYTHPELRPMMWTNPGETPNNGIDDDSNGIVDDVFGADFTSSTPRGDPIDRNSHGTHCAGIIGAKENNGNGIAGVASFTQGKVKIMAVKGLNDRGSGTFSGLLKSLNYAIGKGAKISSNSWGNTRSISDAMEVLWDNVLKNNPEHLFVAAAGNSNRRVDNNYKIMACGLNEPNLICVASSTQADQKSSFSNYGKDFVHVFAPGSSIYSTIPNNRYGLKSGTSMACPHVSGLAALIMTMRNGLNGKDVKELIEANVQKKSGYENLVSSGGLIDVSKTIRTLKDGGLLTVLMFFKL